MERASNAVPCATHRYMLDATAKSRTAPYRALPYNAFVFLRRGAEAYHADAGAAEQRAHKRPQKLGGTNCLRLLV